MAGFPAAALLVLTLGTWGPAPSAPAAAASPAPAAASSAPPATAIDYAFSRIYNLDFPGSFAVLDDHARQDPDDPLTPAVRAVTLLFMELHRLRVLESQFFMNDDNMVDGASHPIADPAVKKRLDDCLAEARRRAEKRLAVSPGDVDGLFTMCLVVGVELDYVAFVERKTWRTVRLARDSARYASALLGKDPPFYDAYLTFGSLEYVVGSLPFYVRWFVHYDGVKGDKRRGIEQLKLVARQGRYYGPFARILLAVVSLREKKFADAETLLAGLAAEFPSNGVFQRELAQVKSDHAREKARQ
jgi:hypothetical protein